MIQRLRQMRNEEGFTLIELLIVIIVLGILAAIVVFAVGNTRDDAVESACNTQLRSVELSAEAINTHEGSYPAGNINSSVAAPGNFLLEGNTADNGALLKSWPSDGDYTLQYEGTASGYSVEVYAEGGFVMSKNDPTDAPDAGLIPGVYLTNAAGTFNPATPVADCGAL